MAAIAAVTSLVWRTVTENRMPRSDDLARPESRVAPQRQRPGRPGPADPTSQLVDEPLGPAGGVGRAGAHPQVQQLAGVGPAGQQRVVAKPVGVAVGGSTLGVAVDLAHRGVDVDRQLLGARAGASGPGSGQEGLGDPVELADVAEGERPQERAQGRGGHHPVPEHLLGPCGAQHLSVIDRVATGHHRVQQGQHLTARPVVAGSAAEVDQLVHHGLHPQPFNQRCGQRQAGVGDGVVVIERDDEGAGGVRRWHRKGALRVGVMAGSQPSFSQLKGPFHNLTTAPPRGVAVDPGLASAFHEALVVPVVGLPEGRGRRRSWLLAAG
jgi:hypothetical protein